METQDDKAYIGWQKVTVLKEGCHFLTWWVAYYNNNFTTSIAFSIRLYYPWWYLCGCCCYKNITRRARVCSWLRFTLLVIEIGQADVQCVFHAACVTCVELILKMPELIVTNDQHSLVTVASFLLWISLSLPICDTGSGDSHPPIV